MLKEIFKKFYGGTLDKKRIRNKNEYKNLYITPEEINEAYSKVDRTKKKLVLGVTSGRSGMKWVYEIFRHHDNADGGGERNVEAEALWRYIKFNKLAIDTQGIIEVTKREILLDWIENDISITVSPYFAHDFLTLIDELKVDDIIWGITNPKFTVTSFYNKGWYEENITYSNQKQTLGFQINDSWSHFLGRVIPSGDKFEKWNALTRVGKVSWFVNMIHSEIYLQILKLPKEKIYLFKLEDADQNYDLYLAMAKHFNLQPIMSKSKFLSLKKLAAKDKENKIKEWTNLETKEFESEMKFISEVYRNKLDQYAPYEETRT